MIERVREYCRTPYAGNQLSADLRALCDAVDPTLQPQHTEPDPTPADTAQPDGEGCGVKADDGLLEELRPLALRVRAEQNTVSDGVRLAHLALRAIDEIERLGTRLDRVVETFNQSCDGYRQRAEQAEAKAD